jgi:hypothetical protein
VRALLDWKGVKGRASITPPRPHHPDRGVQDITIAPHAILLHVRALERLLCIDTPGYLVRAARVRSVPPSA